MKFRRILVRYGGWRLALSVPLSIAGGAAMADLMRLIHLALTAPMGNASGLILRFAALVAVYFAAIVTSRYALSVGGERLKFHLRAELLRQALELPLTRIEAIGLPRLLAALGADVDSLASYLSDLPEAIVNVAIAAGCLVYMAWLSPVVLVFNLLFLLVAAAVYVAPERLARRVGLRAAAAGDRHYGLLLYAMQGVKGLLLSRGRRDEFLVSHFEASGEELLRLNVKHRAIHDVAERLSEAMILGNVGCLLLLLPHAFGLSMAKVTGILLAAIFARQPLKDSLGFMWRTLGMGVPLRRMTDVGLDPFAASPGAENGPPPARPRFRELALVQASFRYPSDHGQKGFRCGPASLKVRAGEVVLICGGNGGGKTTLAKMLCGLYPPDSGAVAVDGNLVTTAADREAHRALFSAVFREEPPFAHILGAPPGLAEGAGRALLSALRLDAKVRLEGGSFTTIDLSQGQRSRLVLIAALLEDRPILLLDEWAADQDPPFREFFYRELMPDLRARGKTVIAVTHDDRYFDCGDRLVKVENGQIVAEATAPVGIGRQSQPPVREVTCGREGAR